jgi:hypothetical protein
MCFDTETCAGPISTALPARSVGAKRIRVTLACILAGFFGLGTLGPDTARAQEPKIQSVTKPAKRKNPEDKKHKNSLKMNEIEILGEVEKPKTMFVIPRAPHQYFWENGKKDFTEEILSPISKQKVEGMEQWRDDTLPP